MNPNINKVNGYSLFEVLIALTLAGVVIATVAFSFEQSIHLQKTLEGRITATILGMSKLAEFEAGSETVSSGDFQSPYSQYHWDAHEGKSAGGSQTIVLTVEWNGGDQHVHSKVFKGFLRP